MEITAHDKAIVMFFTPVISFNLGRLLDSFTLYKVPRNRGKIRTGSVRILSKNPSIIESIKENATKNFKIDSIFLMILALSGIFIASSFKSVNLFSPYILNVIKNVIMAIFNAKILYNSPEKMTLREPLIAKKSDVEMRNEMKLLIIDLNFTKSENIFSLIQENPPL